MAAEYFCEVWKFNDGYIVCSCIRDIDTLEYNLKLTEQNTFAETIAVWRVKPTDVPLQERLAARIGGVSGSYCGTGFFEAVHNITSAIKFQSMHRKLESKRPYYANTEL